MPLFCITYHVVSPGGKSRKCRQIICRREKYHTLGNFPDSWYKGQLKIHPSFHLDSRDIILHDEANASKFYRHVRNYKFSHNRSQMVLDDAEETTRQREGGIIVQITKPKSTILQKYPEKERVRKSRNVKKETLEDKHNTASIAPPADQSLSLDQMWIISSLVGQYLK